MRRIKGQNGTPQINAWETHGNGNDENEDNEFLTEDQLNGPEMGANLWYEGRGRTKVNGHRGEVPIPGGLHVMDLDWIEQRMGSAEKPL